jgi:hypothetical protein
MFLDNYKGRETLMKYISKGKYKYTPHAKQEGLG